MERAGVTGADIDLVLLCTCTPDEAMPATASAIQQALGVPRWRVDLNAACSGFVYGLVAADGFLRAGMRPVLLIGSETMSRIVDWEDRSTAILFGDGAGAVVLDAATGPGGSSAATSVPTARCATSCTPTSAARSRWTAPRCSAARCGSWSSPPSERSTAPGLTVDDVRLFVPHQANIRIIASACAKLGIPEERTVDILATTGNTSAASIPMALADAADAGAAHPGDLVLLIGFGAGMSWASAVIEWAV